VTKNILDGRKDGHWRREVKQYNPLPLRGAGVLGNYRPISLLPISSNVFEKCIYKHIFNFIRDLITEHQSGFTIKSVSSIFDWDEKRY
jgi:hypothetical protein